MRFEVKSLFGCFSLQTGGLIIGWTCFVWTALGFMACLCYLVKTLSCDFLKTYFTSLDCFAGDEVLVLIPMALLTAIVSSYCGSLSYKFIKGITTKNTANMVAMKSLMILLSIVYFIGLFPVGIFFAMFFGYIYVVISSLIEELKQEKSITVTCNQHLVESLFDKKSRLICPELVVE